MSKRGRAGAKLAKQRAGCWSGVGLGMGESKEEDVREKVRADIVKALPALVTALLQKALDGSSVHIKLLMQLERDLAEPQGEERRGKNLEEILMEQWRKDAAERATD